MPAFENIDCCELFFLDIETAPDHACLADCDARVQALWERELERLNRRDSKPPLSADEAYVQEAALMAQFGRIVAIGMGRARRDDAGQLRLVVKSFVSQTEVALLERLAQPLRNASRQLRICGHNLKSFDLPFIVRRMLIKGVALPDALIIADKKPWEVPHLDSLELWKNGGREWASLETLACCFGIPSSKEALDGSMVGEAYWRGELRQIGDYCTKDVVVTAQVFRRLLERPLFDDDCIEVLETEVLS